MVYKFKFNCWIKCWNAIFTITILLHHCSSTKVAFHVKHIYFVIGNFALNVGDNTDCFKTFTPTCITDGSHSTVPSGAVHPPPPPKKERLRIVATLPCWKAYSYRNFCSNLRYDPPPTPDTHKNICLMQDGDGIFPGTNSIHDWALYSLNIF